MKITRFTIEEYQTESCQRRYRVRDTETKKIQYSGITSLAEAQNLCTRLNAKHGDY